MTRRLRLLWDEQPLSCILFLAFVFRLLAAIYAKGWGMFDDHFIVIESAGSWTKGHDYNDWLPWSPHNHGPTGHNFFYPGLHFLIFTLLNWIGISDPQSKMFVIRLLHGLFSLLTVYLGYRIVETLDGKKSARLTGLLLALFWFMPWMGVRNLVEMTCVPFLMAGFWMIIRDNASKKIFQSWVLAGIFFGLAVNLRPQTAIFPFAVGLIYLFTKKWKHLAGLAIGSIGCVTLIQGGIDTYLWGKPFIELITYFKVNIADRDLYITLPWYNYFLTILGLLLPPVSVFLFFGYVRKWKSYFILFFPTLIYFIVHSAFPNKQERFILPMIPVFIMAGSMGWTEFVSYSKFWLRNKRLEQASWWFFWCLNTILLLVFTFTYSKKARVEAMSYLGKYPKVQAIAVIDEENSPEMMPKFYMNQWPISYNENVDNTTVDAILGFATAKNRPPAEFVLFTGDKKIQPLVVQARRYFPYLMYETTIEPGRIDRFIHWLNPINKNRRIFIYRNVAVIPHKIQ